MIKFNVMIGHEIKVNLKFVPLNVNLKFVPLNVNLKFVPLNVILKIVLHKINDILLIL